MTTTSRLAQLEAERAATERMAQELGWPGYSQGGDPVGYMFDSAVEAKAHTTALREALEMVCAKFKDYGYQKSAFSGRYWCYPHFTKEECEQAQAALQPSRGEQG